MSYFLARLALTVSSVTVALCDRGFAATPQAIAEGRFISLGGIEQWVTIRGADRDRPVLLFLHGGPGDAQSSLEDVYAPIERNFVLVQWDQRGAGKTLAHSGRERQGASLEQLIADSIELTKYIRTYLRTSNVVLVGHSWGSYLGIQIVKRQPKLFRAFVGIGQIISWREMVNSQYQYALDRARAEPDSSGVKELETLGVPAFDNFDEYLVMRRHLNRYLAPADSQWLTKQDVLIRARLTDEEFRYYLQGFQSMTGLASTVFSMDTPALGRNFALPVFLIQGAEDHITDATASKGYFDNIRAPIKRLTLIEGAGHFALTTHTEQVGEAIREDLRLARQLNK